MTTNPYFNPDSKNPQPPLHVSIRNARLRLGLEPANVADWLGWTTEYYLTYETGENHPDSITLDEIEKALFKAAKYRNEDQKKLAKWNSAVLTKGGAK